LSKFGEFHFKNCTPSQLACPLSTLLEESASRGEYWGGRVGTRGAPLSRREINSPPGFGEEEGEEFSHMEETASAKST